MASLRAFLRDTYSGLPTATWLAAAAALINRAGSMVMPFLAIYLGDRLGYSSWWTGVVLSAFGVGSVLGNLVGGRLVDRIGAVRTQVAAMVGNGLWLFVLGTATALPTLIAGFLVLGVLADAFRPGNMAAVVQSCAPRDRARALALNRLAINAGWAIGPVLGGVLANVDYRLLFLGNGLGALAAAAFLWRFGAPATAAVATTVGAGDAAGAAPAADGAAAAHRTAAAGSPWRDRRFVGVLVGSTGLMLAFLQYFTIEVRYWRDGLQFSTQQIGLLLTLNPILIVLVEMPLVHALRGRRQLPVVALGAALVGVSWPFLLAATWQVPAVVASLLLLTAGEMLFWPLLTAFVSDVAPPARRGEWLGAYGATFSVAMVVAPALGGFTYDEFGGGWLWSGCAAACLLAAALFVALDRAYRAAAAAGPQPTAAAAPTQDDDAALRA